MLTLQGRRISAFICSYGVFLAPLGALRAENSRAEENHAVAEIGGFDFVAPSVPSAGGVGNLIQAGLIVFEAPTGKFFGFNSSGQAIELTPTSVVSLSQTVNTSSSVTVTPSSEDVNQFDSTSNNITVTIDPNGSSFAIGRVLTFLNRGTANKVTLQDAQGSPVTVTHVYSGASVQLICAPAAGVSGCSTASHWQILSPAGTGFLSASPGSNVSPSGCASHATITSLSLTVGEWDVEGAATFTPGSATGLTSVAGKISTLTTGSDASVHDGVAQVPVISGATDTIVRTGARRFVVTSGTQTVYLLGIVGCSGIGSAVFSTLSYLRARRYR